MDIWYKISNKRIKKRVVLVIFTISLIFFVWWMLPVFLISLIPWTTDKGEDKSRLIKDMLVACGNRANPKIIQEIKQESAWRKGYIYLVFALRENGQTAHDELCEAIETELDPLSRARLVFALQTAFSDYRYLHLVVDDVRCARLKNIVMFHMADSIRRDFNGAPQDFWVDGHITKEYWIYIDDVIGKVGEKVNVPNNPK